MWAPSFSSAPTSNCSHGRPGMFVSGARRRSRFGPLDAPEVDLISDPEVNLVASPAPEPHSAPQGVEESSDLPEPVVRIPAGLTADPLDRLEGPRRQPVDSNRPRCHQSAPEPDATPPRRCPDGKESDHRVSPNSRSSLTRAWAIASLSPRGVTEKVCDACEVLTTVSLRRLSTISPAARP